MLKKQTANSLSRCLTVLHCCRQQSSVKVFCDDVMVMLCVTADYIMCMHTVWLSLVQGYVLTFIYSFAHGEIYQGVYSYCCVVRIAINPWVNLQVIIDRELVNHDTLQQLAHIFYTSNLLYSSYTIWYGRK